MMFRGLFNPTAALADNAMLHKDLTQWLRNKTFAGLFFGLLVIAEIVSVFVVLLQPERGSAGPAAFGILSFILSLYSLIVALSGYSLTAKEFQNRTFELFELSGMSLEKMIRGKFFSMVAQFLFGFFCIVPFMFFAYLLGGLDFTIILTTALWLALAVPPLYLFALAVALHSRKVRAVGTLIRIGAVLMCIYMIPLLMSLLFSSRYGGSPPGLSGGDLLKKLFDLDPDAIRACLVFLAFYFQVCLLLFYACCNAISPATDSREAQIKFFATTLSLSLLALAAWPLLLSGNHKNIYLMLPAFVIMALLGLIFFWAPLDVPLMVRQRQGRARWLTARAFYYWFQPGVKGTFRMILLYWIASSLPVLISLHAFNWGDIEPVLISIPLALPFYIAFPGFFLVRFKGLQYRVLALRMIMLLWWTVGGVAVWIAYNVSNEIPNGDISPISGIFKCFCVIVSPLSAMLLLTHNNSSFPADWFYGWAILGGIGVLLLIFTIIGRARIAQYATPNTEPEITEY